VKLYFLSEGRALSRPLNVAGTRIEANF